MIYATEVDLFGDSVKTTKPYPKYTDLLKLDFQLKFANLKKTVKSPKEAEHELLASVSYLIKSRSIGKGNPYGLYGGILPNLKMRLYNKLIDVDISNAGEYGISLRLLGLLIISSSTNVARYTGFDPKSAGKLFIARGGKITATKGAFCGLGLSFQHINFLIGNLYKRDIDLQLLYEEGPTEIYHPDNQLIYIGYNDQDKVIGIWEYNPIYIKKLSELSLQLDLRIILKLFHEYIYKTLVDNGITLCLSVKNDLKLGIMGYLNLGRIGLEVNIFQEGVELIVNLHEVAEVKPFKKIWNLNRKLK